MNAASVPPGYSLDTNIVIDNRVRYYPPDIFKTLWESFSALIGDERAIVCDEVLWELGRGDDDCKTWAEAEPGLLVPTDDDVLERVAEIVDEFPDWSSEQSNWADPFVIAHAQVRSWAVVTREQWSRSPLPTRTKIPNVCSHFDVPCITFLDMIRLEGWNL